MLSLNFQSSNQQQNRYDLNPLEYKIPFSTQSLLNVSSIFVIVRISAIKSTLYAVCSFFNSKVSVVSISFMTIWPSLSLFGFRIQPSGLHKFKGAWPRGNYKAFLKSITVSLASDIANSLAKYLCLLQHFFDSFWFFLKKTWVLVALFLFFW